MNEIGITKIMDGIFISDMSLIQDYEFLISNKVSHIIIWSASEEQFTLQGSDIKVLRCQKTVSQGSLPSQDQLQSVYDYIQESRQQCLCSLICSEYQSQASMLLTTYIMKKFYWDLTTVFNFISIRFYDFSPRVQVVQQLQDFQVNLQSGLQHEGELKSIQFTQRYLSSYSTDDFEEKLLLNTIKNMFSDKNISAQPNKKRTKRRKRIQWFDRIRSSTSVSSFNCKFVTYNRNTSLKQKSKHLDKQTMKSNQIQVQNNNKDSKLDKKSPHHKYGEFLLDDLEFQSLKDLTRTKTNENRLKGSLRKINSLKIIKTDKSTKENKQNQMKRIYKKEAEFRGTDSKNVFDTLKRMNKLRLGTNA